MSALVFAGVVVALALLAAPLLRRWLIRSGGVIVTLTLDTTAFIDAMTASAERVASAERAASALVTLDR
jgi:arginine exporter protein ArgO